MTPTERAAVAEAIAALEREEKYLMRLCGSSAVGIMRGDIEGAFYRIREILASLRAVAPAPADQSDAGRDSVIEELLRQIANQLAWNIGLPNPSTRPFDDMKERAFQILSRGLPLIVRALASAPSEAVKDEPLYAVAKTIRVQNIAAASALAAKEGRQDYREFMTAENRKLDEAIQVIENSNRPDTRKRRTFDPRDVGFSLVDDDDDLPSETVGSKGEIIWTSELEAARIDLCHFWLKIADDPHEGGARYPKLGRKAIETEQALTLLGGIALKSALPTADRDAIREALKGEERYLIRQCGSEADIMPGDIQGAFHRIRTAALGLLGEG